MYFSPLLRFPSRLFYILFSSNYSTALYIHRKKIVHHYTDTPAFMHVKYT
jgi:hypothetical protein